MTKKRTQISFDIDQEVHRAIKIDAAQQLISMNLWLMRAIYKALRKDKDNT
jgi:predicted HicB family RNase H-like nuclease